MLSDDLHSFALSQGREPIDLHSFDLHRAMICDGNLLICIER